MANETANGAAQPGDFHLAVGAQTDTGRVRANNQDSIGTWQDLPQTVPFPERGYLFAVADGVGGNEQGEVASALAIETLFHTYYSGDTNDTYQAVRAAFNRANEQIMLRSADQPEDRQMGTTLVVGVIKGTTLTVGNVGDSRAYLFRGRTNAIQITKDHSLVAEAVRAGQMTTEQARTSRQRNVITRALGSRPKVEVDIFEVDLMGDDIIVLCSDGLHGIIENTEIKQIVQAVTPEQAAVQLIELANSRNASDNISAIVVKAMPEVPLVLGAPMLPDHPAAELTTNRLPTVTPTRPTVPIAAIIGIVILIAAIIAFVLLVVVRR